MRILYISLFSTVIALFQSNLTKAQSANQEIYISRDATAAAGETIGNDKVSITYILGEAVGELFSNPEASKYVSAGFVQPDFEAQEILSRDITRNFTVFPNPVRNGVIKLAFSNVADGRYTVDIIDVLGRTVKSEIVNFKKDDFLYAEIDVSAMVKGIYFLRVGNKDVKGQVKLIKL